MQVATILFLSLLAWLAGCVDAYVPASPTNSTDDAIAGGVNMSDISQLHLQWYSNGWFWDSSPVSYQLVGEDSDGVSQGVLVHFDEYHANNNTPPTPTPWIALVSCDYNATNADEYVDVFTQARDKGAVAALLYSLYSHACIINPEYADPEVFDQVFDIFSTQSNYASNQIEYSFKQVNTNYSWYDSERLNASYQSVSETYQTNATPDSGYLFATLRAYNASGSANITDTGSGPGGGSSDSSNSSNTALAMIVLYAITGCVSALFCVVIVLGAIRAFRHPERYGPRRGGVDGVAQSRAGGLGRAILDTFPIVKFASNPSNNRPAQSQDKDIEAWSPTASSNAAREHEMHDVSYPMHPPQALMEQTPGGSTSQADDMSELPPTAAEGSQLTKRPPKPATSGDEVMPEAIGRETCPICIVDFEEGDDLRQLPCEGHHRFHQECVDPWLLELSSSCPICRQDFLALENMLSNDSQPSSNVSAPPSASPNRETRGSRFSRYVRSAIRRRHHQDTDQNTSPPMPTPPDPVHTTSP